MPSPVVRLFVRALVERPARRTGPAKLVARLEAGLAPLEARFRAVAGDPKALRTLRHIVTIERWGQGRLRVALGDRPYARDESGAYAPASDAPYEGLLDQLRATRAETVTLARRVADEGKAAVLVDHNSLGPLTAAGWLQYLNVHADFEAKRVRAS
jgi:hypothetical protein